MKRSNKSKVLAQPVPKQYRITSQKHVHGRKHPKSTFVQTPKLAILAVMVAYVGILTLASIIVIHIMRNPQNNNSTTKSPSTRLASVQIDKVTTKAANKQSPFQLPERSHFVIISLTLRNYSSSSFDFAPVLQTFLTDSTGTHFEMSPTELDTPIAAGKMMPLTETGGQLSYIVPDDAKGLRFHFVPDQSNGLYLNQLIIK